jgi:hypothetical protein
MISGQMTVPIGAGIVTPRKYSPLCQNADQVSATPPGTKAIWHPFWRFCLPDFQVPAPGKAASEVTHVEVKDTRLTHQQRQDNHV